MKCTNYQTNNIKKILTICLQLNFIYQFVSNYLNYGVKMPYVAIHKIKIMFIQIKPYGLNVSFLTIRNFIVPWCPFQNKLILF